MRDLAVTKKFLQKYHDHVKDLPLQERYPSLTFYKRDADGNVMLDENGNKIIDDGGATIIDAINDKLSKEDYERWDEKNHSFNVDGKEE